MGCSPSWLARGTATVWVSFPPPVWRGDLPHLAYARTSSPPSRHKRSPDRLGGFGRAAHSVHHGGGFIATVHHTIGAARVATRAILVPVGLCHQLLKRRRIAVSHEIAGLLPAQHTVVRIAPGSALVLAPTLEKIQKEGRVIEVPFPPGKHSAKQRLGAFPLEKMLLVWGFLIAIPRRHHEAIDAERRGIVKKGSQLLSVFAFEDRSIGGDAEPCRLGRLDGSYSDVKSALTAHQLVVALPETVEVHAEGEVRGRSKSAQMLL